MTALSAARVAGAVYFLYLLVGLGAGTLAGGNIAALARGQASGPATTAWLASTVVYALLVVLLARLVWTVDARTALAATGVRGAHRGRVRAVRGYTPGR